MDDVTIRPATVEDAPEIQRVARESWHAAYDEIVGAEAVESVVDDWYDPEGLERSVGRDDGRFLVAEVGSGAEAGTDDETGAGSEAEIEDEIGAEDEAETGVESDAEVVGFAQGVLADEDESTDDAARLPRIYVHPDRWGEGVGSELLDRIESWVADRGAERLRLIVLADNEVGNAFYGNRGYRTVGSRESEFEGETVTDHVREKEL